MKKQPLLSALSVGLFTLGMVSNVYAAPITGQGTWESTLQGRDLDGDLSTFEAYYDTTLDITWLADANYAQTSGYDADGKMTWQAANDWAAQLMVGGVSGWRLADTIDVGNDGATYSNIYQGVDYGYNITTQSELSNMFYNVLGNTAWYDTSGTDTACTAPNYCLTNTGPFSNLQSYAYWSATEYAPNISDAWNFNMSIGFQRNLNKSYSFYAWAVHSGDVGVSAVPVPAAVWLFGSGLLGLLGVAKRKRAQTL